MPLQHKKTPKGILQIYPCVDSTKRSGGLMYLNWEKWKNVQRDKVAQIKISNVCSLTYLSPMDGCNGNKLFGSLGRLTLILLSIWMSLIILNFTLHFLKVYMIKIILGSNGVINSFLALIVFLNWSCFFGGFGGLPCGNQRGVCKLF
jgi:hypothetical protein